MAHIAHGGCGNKTNCLFSKIMIEHADVHEIEVKSSRDYLLDLKMTANKLYLIEAIPRDC